MLLLLFSFSSSIPRSRVFVRVLYFRLFSYNIKRKSVLYIYVYTVFTKGVVYTSSSSPEIPPPHNPAWGVCNIINKVIKLDDSLPTAANGNTYI